MPDDSCRNCGGLLLNYSLCGKCKAPLQFICRICATKTIERFHEGFCFRLDESGINRKIGLPIKHGTIISL